MIRTLLLAAGSALALTTAASAADIPVQVPAAIVAPAAFATHNWTGFNVGLLLGYAFGNGDTTYTGNPAFLGGVVTPGLAPGGYGLDPAGFTGGLALGYDIQFGQFVAGIVADISLMDARDSASSTLTVGADTLTTSASTRMNWFSTVRGRLGFAFDRVLIYGTGGLAIAEVRGTGDITGAGGLAGLAWSGASTSTRTGWTLGAGVEWAVARNISVRAEYLYYDLGRFDVSVAPTNPATVATGISAVQRHDIDGHIVRAGVSFRF